MPTWGADLSDIDFDQIRYYVSSTEGQAASWEDLPEDIKSTYDKLGIPEAEKQRLVAGVAAQYESEVVTTRSVRTWRKRALSSWTLILACVSTKISFKEYFASVIPAGDNKFSR